MNMQPSLALYNNERVNNERKVFSMKQVIVACGSGVATSQTVASKVNRMLKENDVEASVLAVDIKSVDRYIAGSVAYIAITKVNKEYPIPVINGIAFLTGVGADAEFKKLVDAIDAAE